MSESKNVGITIGTLNFRGGVRIEMDPGAIVVIVGPNNAGKSSVLREVERIIRSSKGASPLTVLESLEWQKQGNTEDLLAWLSENFPKRESSDRDVFLGLNQAVDTFAAKQMWGKEELGGLTNFFCLHLDTASRLAASVPPPNDVDLLKNHPRHPCQKMISDDTLELAVAVEFERSFPDHTPILDRCAGASVPMFVGTRPTLSDNEDRVSASYLRKLRELPQLVEQGDGMRSYAGILMHLLAYKFSIMCVDEPSVFLHPPQARALGQAIVNIAPQNSQVLMATHDGDFLRGILDANNDRVKIIRLNRTGNTTIPSELKPSTVNEIWSSSLLRHSNILDALFHNNVIISESDSDSLFYKAVLDEAYTEKKTHPPDIRFVHGGGKARIPFIATALQALHVPVKVIADIDLLQEEHLLKRTVEALNYEWADVRPLWQAFFAKANKTLSHPKSKDVKVSINEIFDQCEKEWLPKTVADQIKALLRATRSWSQLKKNGVYRLNHPDLSSEYLPLEQKLNEVGIFIPTFGDIESFGEPSKLHGPRWVAKALEDGVEGEDNFREAKDFIFNVLVRSHVPA